MATPDLDRAGGPWVSHRRRAELLSERYPFAAEMLTLYRALAEVWADGWDLAHQDRPEPACLPQWTAERLVHPVVRATEAAGPEPLAKGVRALLDAGDLTPLAGWLAGDELPPVERYLARACLTAPLAALGADAGAACAADPSPRGGGRCPHCGGAPQCSIRSDAGDGLVRGRRLLLCARCGQEWTFSASTCPSCGETTGSRRTLYAERHHGPVVARDGGATSTAGAAPDASTFPHLRVDACATCQRYVIDVDLSRDPRAVPAVDELAALPLDLYAVEQGLSKITPNLMGF